MRRLVLKAFPYAHDGITAKMMEVGKTEEFRADLVLGLVAAGLLQGEEAKGQLGRAGLSSDLEIPGFVVKKIKKGEYRVVDKDGKPQHDGVLSESDAKELAADLNKPKPTDAWAIVRGEGDSLEYYGGRPGGSTEPVWTKDKAQALTTDTRSVAEEAMKDLDGDLSLIDLNAKA
jgi:hypothetical protein